MGGSGDAHHGWQGADKEFRWSGGGSLVPELPTGVCNFAPKDVGGNDQFHRYLLVTDQVCGMTDTFAKRLHSELNNG